MNAAKNTLNSFKRLSALSVGVIAFVGMAAFSNANAQATTTTATSSAPMISGIALTGGGSGIVTMHWMTDMPATSQVRYGPIGMAYSSSTPLNSTLVTSHAVMVGGLASGPLYHFSVSSASALGMLATSTDRAFVLVGSTGTSTTGTSTTATSTGSTGSGGTGTSTSTTATSTGSTGSGTGSTGTGTSTTGTSTTATSTDVSFLQNRIWQLEGLVEWLRDQIALLQGTNHGGGGSGAGGGTGNTGGGTGNTGGDTDTGGGTGGTGTTTTGTGGTGGVTTGGGSSSGQMGTLTPNNTTVRAGTTIDLGGRGFAPNQDYTVMTNGQRVGAAHSDSGGNFSTGSLPVSGTVGSQTYSLIGSGGTMQVTVNVIP